MKSSPAGKVITGQCLLTWLITGLRNLSLAGFGDIFKKLQLQVFVITHATVTL